MKNNELELFWSHAAHIHHHQGAWWVKELGHETWDQWPATGEHWWPEEAAVTFLTIVEFLKPRAPRQWTNDNEDNDNTALLFSVGEKLLTKYDLIQRDSNAQHWSSSDTKWTMNITKAGTLYQNGQRLYWHSLETFLLAQQLIQDILRLKMTWNWKQI